MSVQHRNRKFLPDEPDHDAESRRYRDFLTCRGDITLEVDPPKDVTGDPITITVPTEGEPNDE